MKGVVRLRWLPPGLYRRALIEGAKRDRHTRLYFDSMSEVPVWLEPYCVKPGEVTAPLAPITGVRTPEAIEAAAKFRAEFDRKYRHGRPVRRAE